jgi:redox-sensitive bicupin YhaK (pirin superfamily)
LDAGASLSLPPAASDETIRTLYFFRGPSLDVSGESVTAHAALAVKSDVPVRITAGAAECEVLVLQGKPIGEPVVAHGPFVMNAPREIQEAIDDYRRTQFGGWPWPVDDPVHGKEEGRFARHADGRVERVGR